MKNARLRSRPAWRASALTCPVSPDNVWAVLADARTFSNWVVGTRHTRSVDECWTEVDSVVPPAAGLARLPRDETTVEQSQPPKLVITQATGVTLGDARIDHELRTKVKPHVEMMCSRGSAGSSDTRRKPADPARTSGGISKGAGSAAGRDRNVTGTSLLRHREGDRENSVGVLGTYPLRLNPVRHAQTSVHRPVEALLRE
jgi:hypothetical protein